MATPFTQFVNRQNEPPNQVQQMHPSVDQLNRIEFQQDLENTNTTTFQHRMNSPFQFINSQSVIRESQPLHREEGDQPVAISSEDIFIDLNETSTSSSIIQSDTHNTEERRCWICYGEENDSIGKWVKPCRCSLICHEECLLNWITEKQKTLYRLNEHTPLILRVMSFVDNSIQALIPYFTIFGLTFAVVITNVHYGAYAMVTMLGLENGHHLLNEPWIPILLIFSRARIADPVMPLIPMFLVRMNHLRMTMPPNPMELNWRRQIEPYTFSTQNENGEDDNNNNVQQQYDQDMSDRLDRNNAGRKIVGALFLPFISAMVGGIPDSFHRNIIGGCLFIVLKDIVNLTYKYQRVINRRTRQIKNYSEFSNDVNKKNF
ncbi:13292_t:CDS:2 [Entrophospora sp. SA101]|nr:6995_t:CDS:2 [Entrophospora sp. SA101]CAJ0629663.1 5870_t:CDS:2 [Entrophospora sp. SA101]CAJ0762579.1 13292_t:CDS:2 [Entrophospora sp. SA101]CAJ0903537.1 119_t:CDS:2 [Entrophospora sp. SA101]